MSQIFEAEYADNNVESLSSDSRYRVPKGLRVYNKQICNYEFTSNFIEDLERDAVDKSVIVFNQTPKL